jgi:type I site-specific restriction endonuclease
MKTINLGGFSRLQRTLDHIYLKCVNGEKYPTVNGLISALREEKYPIDGETLRVAQSLGYIKLRPYLTWEQVGPLTEHHIKILMYEVFLKRKQKHHTYKDVDQAFFSTEVPNCKYKAADKEALRLKRLVAGMNESASEAIERIKETTMFPKTVETLVNNDSIARTPSVIKVVLSSTGVIVSSDNVMLELKGKFTLEYSN